MKIIYPTLNNRLKTYTTYKRYSRKTKEASRSQLLLHLYCSSITDRKNDSTPIHHYYFTILHSTCLHFFQTTTIITTKTLHPIQHRREKYNDKYSYRHHIRQYHGVYLETRTRRNETRK